MNNSNGGLKEYWDAFRGSDALWGGFIWDLVDQGLQATTPDGQRYWAYGGDFGDQPNDGQFCINGLLFPDRSPHPVGMLHPAAVCRVESTAAHTPSFLDARRL
jgi:beta-galactosidase